MQVQYIIFLAMLFLSIISRARTIGTFKRFMQHSFVGCKSIRKAAALLLEQYGLKDIRIEEAEGVSLSDLYMPDLQTIVINKKTAGTTRSLTMCTALHETGKAIEFNRNGLLRLLKNYIYPFVRGITILLIPAVIATIIMKNSIVMDVAVWACIAFFVLSLVMVLFERKASGYGVAYLSQSLQQEDMQVAKKIFAAIDLTYISMTFSGVTLPFKMLAQLIFRPKRDRAAN